MNKETVIAIPADPDNPEDRDVSVAEGERGLMGRRIRMLRTCPGLTQEAFAAGYGIPLGDIRQYEIDRHIPPPAVRAYLTVIDRVMGQPKCAAGGLLADNRITATFIP